MDNARVSVVIPAYRCAGTIGQTIQSLLRQTRRPDEIIVVDDGSPDDLEGALCDYRGAVRLLHKSNGGAASARNAGIDACRGDFLAFVDADDLWHSAKLESQLGIFSRHPEVGMVSGRYLIKDGSTVTEWPPVNEMPHGRVIRAQGPEIFELAMMVWTSAVIFKRELLCDERFDTSLPIAEDRDLWVRLVGRAPLYLQADLVATLVGRPNSLSRSDLELDCRCMLRIIRRHAKLLGRSGRRKWEAQVYRRWAGTYLGHGQPRQALRPAMRRLSYQPLSPEAWWVLGKAWTAAVGRRNRNDEVSMACCK
jgi:glycosyltransferase involved in cell wall biosynthesis